MGRRSTKTTKTGKFMNPTDQWRKQCRKRELKKNRQQRTAVREAVIKSKNPQQLLAEIEEIEKMEIETGGEEPPNDKGLKEKKRKLHETLQRIINFYEREDYSKAQQVKTLIVESEKRRRDMTTVYSSYKTARSQYNVSDIPLPEGPGLEEEGLEINPSDIPLPEGPSTQVPPGLIPPGPPPGPPPDIVYPKAFTTRSKRAVHFDEDDDDDISSTSSVSSGSDQEDEDDSDENEDSSEEEDKDSYKPQDHTLPEPPPRPPGPPPGLPPPGIRYPPPLFPPPHHPTHISALPPMVPHMPPRPLLPPANNNKPSPHFQSSAVISAFAKTDKQSAVISAQPQIRNVQAEVTKFLPTSLRVRRDNPKQMKPSVRSLETASKQPKSSSRPDGGAGSGSTGIIRGDAYEAFMKEMQGLI